MIAIVEYDDLVAGTIRAAIGTDVALYRDLAELKTALTADATLDTVILGPSVNQQAACETAAGYRAKRPELGFILVRPRLDTVVVTEAIRAGIRDVVLDRDMTQLNEAVKRSQRLTSEFMSANDSVLADLNKGRIITVFSAKGGCGKTTVATNLATYLAESGKGSVALIDLDLAFGDVSIAMQLRPEHSIADAVSMGDTLDAVGLQRMMLQHQSGVQVLAAPPTPDLAEKVHESVIIAAIDALASQFNYVIIDTAPAMDAATLAAFDASDTIVMLTTLDVPSLKNAKLSLETMRVLGFRPEQLRLVLNRADAKVGLNPNDVSDALGLAISGSLPSSRDIPASTNRGEVLVSKEPKHPFSSALAEFAETQLVTTVVATEDTKSRRSIFRRK